MSLSLRTVIVTAALATAVLASASPPAVADGQPVISLMLTTLGRTGVAINSIRASPVVSARVIGWDINEDRPLYDLNDLRPVVSRPVRSVTNGENFVIEYDDEAAARMSHAMPDVSGGHNPGLWNLRSLSPSVR